MDITPQDSTTQPISDDQDLAKALAGVAPEAAGFGAQTQGLSSYEQQAVAPAAVPSFDTVSSAPATSSMPTPTPTATPEVRSTPDDADRNDTSTGSLDLDNIKNNALKELRPLIGKVDLPAEEKFDTYLMLIRSTDDTSLIEPAHAAAQNISDEKRKAEALLDIIKEIDYLSRKDK